MSKKANTGIPRKLLIEEVRRVANLLIKVPTMEDYDKYTKIGKAVTCGKKFAGWKNFLIAAGFDPSASRITHNADELKNEFKRIATMLGHTPTIPEFNKFSKIGKAGTLAHRFGDGKWGNACVALGYPPPKRVLLPKMGGWNKGINRADVNLDELKYLYEIEGLSMSAIAKKLGVGHDTIRRRMDLAGIKARRHYYSQSRQTVPETLLYEELERQRIPFMKQQPVDGFCVVDALVPGVKIVIECDGDYWHRPDDKGIARRDQKKNKYLESRGYLVFRFWESEIEEDVGKCVEKISDVWKKYKSQKYISC